MSSWKAAENRIGVFFGAKGIGKSGRLPLSGGSSGSSRSDSPHRTIFIESKRDKRFHSVIKLWRSIKKTNDIPTVQALPIVENNKIVSKNSDLWCFHNNDMEQLVDRVQNDISVPVHDWHGAYPSALTLYQESVSIKNSTILDKDKEVVCCCLVYHRSPGFWIVIDKNDIVKCWDLILLEREHRDRLIQEEEVFKEKEGYP